MDHHGIKENQIVGTSSVPAEVMKIEGGVKD